MALALVAATAVVVGEGCGSRLPGRVGLPPWPIIRIVATAVTEEELEDFEP